MGTEPLYLIQGLEFSYMLGKCPVPALKKISLELPKGDFICLAGPSGSGKTTLLNVLGLIEAVQGGDVVFQGQSLRNLAEAERNRIRRFKIGFVFQTFQLFPVLRADENIEYFLSRQGIPARERRERVKSALEAVGLWEHRHKRPLEMSGGQRQRVAVARAIAKRPEVIIADEPTASLDQTNGRAIMEIFQRLNRETGVSVVISSHDPMVQRFATHLVNLKDGEIC